jgi:hypothetical protein
MKLAEILAVWIGETNDSDEDVVVEETASEARKFPPQNYSGSKCSIKRGRKGRGQGGQFLT